MAEFRVQVYGPMLVFRNGTPVRLRTRQLRLLLSWMIVQDGRPLVRETATDGLWPDADPDNARAYLRRAIKELRDLGFEIRAMDRGLALDLSNVTSDLADDRLSGTIAWDRQTILADVDHPIAEELRGAVSREFSRSEPKRDVAGTTGAWNWLGRRLLRQRSADALSLIAGAWADFSVELPPEEQLTLLLEVLDQNPTDSHDCRRVTSYTSYVANLVTRYGLSERLALESLKACESSDDADPAAFALGVLILLMLETRQWTRGLDYGRRGVEWAERSGNEVRVRMCRNNLAGLQWHMLDFKGSAENYRLAWETAVASKAGVGALTIEANVAYLRAIFGTPIAIPIDELRDIEFTNDFVGMTQSYLVFSLAFERMDAPAAADSAARLLTIAAAQEMERYVAVALDCAAFAFVRRELSTEAAVCVRVGSRLRARISHHRSPAESLAVRRHVQSPLFSSEIAALDRAWWSDDLRALAYRIASRLGSR